jgi:hypothetical protein
VSVCRCHFYLILLILGFLICAMDVDFNPKSMDFVLIKKYLCAI